MAKAKGLNFNHKENKLNKHILFHIIEMIVSTIIVIFIAFVLTYTMGSRTSIIGDSMEPSLEASSQILINKIVYMISAPKKGDVVVFLPNGNINTHFYIKRIVASPGDTVQIIDGRLYVNGFVAESDDKYDRMEDAGMAEAPVLLGDNEYFVLGDNRNSSEDSRSGNIGPVSKDIIIGKAWLKLPYGNDSFRFVQ